MKRQRVNAGFCKLVRHLMCVLLLLQGSVNVSSAHEIPAFPGAEGFGRYATAGRGGKVYHVTTLEDGKQAGTVSLLSSRLVHFHSESNQFVRHRGTHRSAPRNTSFNTEEQNNALFPFYS